MFVQVLTNVYQTIVTITIANVRVTSKMIKFLLFDMLLFMTLSKSRYLDGGYCLTNKLINLSCTNSVQCGADSICSSGSCIQTSSLSPTTSFLTTSVSITILSSSSTTITPSSSSSATATTTSSSTTTSSTTNSTTTSTTTTTTTTTSNLHFK